jgi:hypothetical protein
MQETKPCTTGAGDDIIIVRGQWLIGDEK